ncbi:MAG: DUF4331 family protein [Lewinellaceae bacterium]|nr:DUF4331 family protein [Saprospiraceae bacterium]MCB9329722.1 DUF4331 family protein [Lewinellaceae bacterium]
MNKKNLLITLIVALVASLGVLWAADHIDAPGVSSTSSDITDYYAFESPENNDNLVFVCNTQGLLDPTASATAAFDENVLLEFNIDNTGDNVEDLVIQAIFQDGKVRVYGPVKPDATGTISTVQTSGMRTDAAITAYGATPAIGTNSSGIKVFAGPRDDPFFMDFAQFGKIIAGNATGFNNPGSDTFAGTNVLSVVVEVPKTMLGSAAMLNTWVESKRKI